MCEQQYYYCFRPKKRFQSPTSFLAFLLPWNNTGFSRANGLPVDTLELCVGNTTTSWTRTMPSSNLRKRLHNHKVLRSSFGGNHVALLHNTKPSWARTMLTASWPNRPNNHKAWLLVSALPCALVLGSVSAREPVQALVHGSSLAWEPA